jgi:hypothetical protein
MLGLLPVQLKDLKMQPKVEILFYKEVAGKLKVTRTELCDNEFEADLIIEAEEGHYDKVSIVDLREKT